MTLRAFLEHRRNELVYFFGWRFGTRYWTGPLCYSTGLPRWICRKLRCFPIEGTDPQRHPSHTVSVRDLVRAEDAALSLGFRPTLPKGKQRMHLRPPPPNLPPPTDPSVKIRFKNWQRRNTINKSERKQPAIGPTAKIEENLVLADNSVAGVEQIVSQVGLLRSQGA